MHCIDPVERNAKAGMTLLEVMVGMAVFSLLGAGLWMNVSLTNQSFQFNTLSNRDSIRASNVINRMVHGTPNYWGIRLASPTMSVVEQDGDGWEATLRHNILDTSGLPAVMQTTEMPWVYDAGNGTITVDGTLVADNVISSTMELMGDKIHVSVEIKPSTGRREDRLDTHSEMKTDVYLRNR